MAWNQFETIKKIQKFWVNQMLENTEKQSKLPFYNAYPYRPSKEMVKRLKEGVKNIQIVVNK